MAYRVMVLDSYNMQYIPYDGEMYCLEAAEMVRDEALIYFQYTAIIPCRI